MKRLNESGYIALITILIIGAIVTTISVFLLLTGVSSSNSSRSVDAYSSAKAAAEGCAELALAAIQANTSLTTPSTGSQTLNSTTKETCTYSITGTTPSYTITATGNVNQTGTNYTHNVTISLSSVVPELVIASWQDSP